MTAFGAVFVALVCWAAGRLLFARLGIRLRRTEHDLLACFAGAPLISLATFLLSCAGLARTPVFLLFALLLWWVHKPFDGDALPPVPVPWRWTFWLAFAFYAVIYLSNSLAPEKSPDGMAYHLGLVARYFTQHGVRRDTTNMYGLMPQGMEMLYLLAFSIGRHAAAATVHCLTLLALPLMILSYSRRIGQPAAGVIAGMLVYLSPIVGIDGVSAYNDVALAASAFALFYLLEIWRERHDAKLLIPIGLLAGFCFSIKYTGFAAALYALLVVRRCLTPASVASAMAIALPWVFRNWLWTGNPVSPLFNSVFRNPFIHISFENFYRGYFRNYGLPSFKPLPWMLTVTGELGGQLGPLFLLAPLALLAARTERGRFILLAAACFLVPWPANIGTRFLIPVLPFMALAMVLVFSSIRLYALPVIGLAAVLAWPRVIDRYRAPAGGWQITTVPWQAALGIVPASTWLRTRSSEYVVAETINAAVPANSTIWSTDALAEAYLNPKILVNYYSAQGESLQDILSIALHPDLQPLWRLRFTFEPRILHRLRIVQRGHNDQEIWSIGEAHFFHGQTELHATGADAQPFPWDIRLALDGNPVTRWRTWEPIRPGMYADFYFRSQQTVDRVELDCSHDQWSIDLALEGIDANPEKVELKPASDLRRQATQTVLSHGIDYLFIGHNNQLAASMRTDPAGWGLRLVAEPAGGALYKIE